MRRETGTARERHQFVPMLLICAAASASMGLARLSQAGILLNDTWADGDRTSVGLPTNSPTWIGQSAGNGSNSVTPGALNFTLPTNSLKVWTYFTADGSAPDGNQPHNSVPQMGVGDTLTATVQFNLPAGATSANTSKNFRIGLFHDPTDARVQSDTNSDGGGGTSPWADATGYIIQMPLNATTTNSNPMQLGKRTTSNTSLAGASGAYSFAPTGGTAYSVGAGQTYTATLQLNMVSATQMDVTATLLDGSNTVLSTRTVSDLGTSFGGTAIGGGLLPGSQSVYTNFDQLFFRSSDNSQATQLSFTNWKVELVQVPEPAMMSLLGIAGFAGMCRRGRRH